jgi:hypothetical protein
LGVSSLDWRPFGVPSPNGRHFQAKLSPRGLNWNQNMVALRDPQLERACQHLAAGFALTPEERMRRGLDTAASLKEEAAAIGGLDPAASSFRANARKFCQRKLFASGSPRSSMPARHWPRPRSAR